jgi:hypothetical protein
MAHHELRYACRTVSSDTQPIELSKRRASGRTPVFACPICGEKITTEINYLAVTLR